MYLVRGPCQYWKQRVTVMPILSSPVISASCNLYLFSECQLQWVLHKQHLVEYSYGWSCFVLILVNVPIRFIQRIFSQLFYSRKSNSALNISRYVYVKIQLNDFDSGRKALNQNKNLNWGRLLSKRRKSSITYRNRAQCVWIHNGQLHLTQSIEKQHIYGPFTG